MVWTVERSCVGAFLFWFTVTGENYLKTLKDDFIPQLNFIGEGRPDYFMQDGVPAHNATAVRQWLDKNWAPWVGPSIAWSQPNGLFLGGHLKQLVFAMRLEDIDHLRSRIRDACQKIDDDRQLLNGVYDNFHHRIDLCMTSSGEHFEHL